jgi:hypothetical protein
VIRRFTIASIVVLALLIVAARAIGSTNTPPALAMLDPGDCPQPCWHGIRPGVTTVEEAKAILNATSIPSAIGYLDPNIGCWKVSSANNTFWLVCPGKPVVSNFIPDLELWPPEDTLRLGEVVSYYGKPIKTMSLDFDMGLDATVGHKQYKAVVLELESNVKVVAYTKNLNDQRIDPKMVIYQLTLFAGNVPFGCHLRNWHGFTHIQGNCP